MYDKEFLRNMYDGLIDDDNKSYIDWLEVLLVSRLNRIDELESIIGEGLD